MKLKDYLEDNGVVLWQENSVNGPQQTKSLAMYDYVEGLDRVLGKWFGFAITVQTKTPRKTNSKYRADPGRRNRCQGNEQGYLLFARLFPTCKKRKGLIQSHSPDGQYGISVPYRRVGKHFLHR